MDKKYLSFFVIFSVLIIILSIYFVLASLAVTNITFSQNTTVHNNTAYDIDGTVHLNWTNATGDSNYSIYIYLDDVYFTITAFNDSANISGSERGYVFTNTTDGNYTFTIEARNETGGTGYVNSTNISVIIDTTDPAIELRGFTNLTLKKNTENVTLNISLSDATSGLTGSVCLINVNGANKSIALNASWCNTTGVNLTGLADGNNRVNIYVNDTATNLGLNNSFFVLIDTTAPSPSLTKTSSGQTSLELSISGKEGTCTVDRSGATISDSTVTETGLSCGNSYPYIVTCTDAAGNAGSSSATSFSTTGCSSSGGSGGISSQPKKASYSFSKITPGNVSIMKNFDAEIGIKEIQIQVNNNAQNVKITVTKYDNKPAAVSVEKTGKVYQYIQIDATNLGNNLDKATVQFRVEKSWISSNGLDKDEISVFKFNENSKAWDELLTVYNSSDNTYDFFDVELTSFSYFAISEKTVVVEEEEETSVVKDISETIGDISEKAKKNLTWLWIVIAVLVVLAAVIMNRKKINFLKK